MVSSREDHGRDLRNDKRSNCGMHWRVRAVATPDNVSAVTGQLALHLPHLRPHLRSGESACQLRQTKQQLFESGAMA